MEIATEHIVDASEPNHSGSFDYYYAYTLFRFIDRECVLVVRAYDDESERAHFLRKEHNGEFRLLTREDTALELFLKACDHLRNVEGKTDLSILVNGAYEAIP